MKNAATGCLLTPVLGGFLGIVLAGVQLLLLAVTPGESVFRAILLLVNRPAVSAVEWYAQARRGGNVDQCIPQWIMLHFAYWIGLGVIAATVVYAVVRAVGKE